jgi:hypothetical protein
MADVENAFRGKPGARYGFSKLATEALCVCDFKNLAKTVLAVFRLLWLLLDRLDDLKGKTFVD